ncbi:MAG: hypothetical protein V4594_03385 [Bacteroidota bacterium]
MTATKQFVLDSPAPSNKEAWLEQQINSSPALASLILEYEYGNGKLQLVKIVSGSLVLENDTQGHFEVGYELNEFSLCAAIDYTATHRMVVKFSINEQTVVLTGEDRRERSDEI